MSVTKKARRSDSLYYDNSKMPRRTLCDMVAQLEEDKRELHTKNVKLLELVAKLHRCARGALRDLAPSCVDESRDGCGMDCTDNGERCCMALLEQCMRELGVEVGE